MLSGTVLYKDCRYNAYGYDSPKDFKLRLSSSNYKNIVMMASSTGVEQGDELWERGLAISSAKVSVETATSRDTGKLVKSPVNAEFFCSLGATIRYVKSHCYTRYMEGYSVINLASGEYEPEKEIKYIIPFEKTKDILAIVKLRLGNVTSMHIKSGLFTIDLEDDKGLDGEVYPVFKDGVNKGFALNEDYLGFPLKPQVVETSSLIGGMYRTLDEVIKAHPEKDFLWLREKNYRIVTDDMLEDLCDYIYNFDGKVYYDTETTGFNINFKSRCGQADQCVGIILSVKDGESFFFPMQMKSIKNLCGGDHAYFMERYMRRILEQKNLVAHNLAFDWKVAYIYDINANIVDDTMALIKLTLGSEDEQLPVALKELTHILLNRDALELDDLVIGDSWGENDIKFWDLTEELVKLYACADTDNTRGLDKYAERHNLLHKYGAHKVYEIEIAFAYAVAYQEFYGHLIDVDNVDVLREQIDAGMHKYKDLMVEAIGHDFNPNSSPQLLKILYHELGYPQQISRKTNRPTTDKNALTFLAEITNIDGEVMYPVCGSLLKYREYEGIRKIIDKFPELATTDGYLFSGVQQYGTRTGRVSIKEPNYQSYNKAVKENIIPRPGYYMFDTDYSSIEYRVLGNMSGNKMIKESFYDPDFDYHTYQAARMYGVPYASVTGRLRKAAKGINFGLPYGMGDQSLGVRIFGEESEENTLQAANLRRSYFRGQEDIQVFFDNARNSGVRNGYTCTYFGRRRYYDSKKYSIGAIKRQAGNQVIQGCLAGETTIITKKYGFTPIESVAGERLDVWDGKAWTKGDITYSGRKKKCIVTFDNGMRLRCSPTHKFRVVSSDEESLFIDCSDLQSMETSETPHKVLLGDVRWNNEADFDTPLGVLSELGTPYDIGRRLAIYSIRGFLGYEDDADADYITSVLERYESGYSQFLTGGYIGDEALAMADYTKSLIGELLGLDIDSVPDDIDPSCLIMSSSEMLRGYICGSCDVLDCGDMRYKSANAVEHLDGYMRTLQKMLLSFGIRSSYETDGYLTIEDKSLFNEIIMSSSVSCENADSGRYITVKSVEYTNEEIKMYDVCNTDRGYFIADGVITHNSAADIYKIAVGRVFKRLCKEGWLGKVMLTGFIHDELLGEVSCEIDPMKWLKVLREEFEVSIEEANGDKWCPLYMGFGWGRNWQEAKSVEVPIKLQWELVEKYGSEGLGDAWDKDIDKFCDSIPDMIRVFEIKDCGRQLLDEANQGKEIKPALNSNILNILKYDRKVYKECIDSDEAREKYHISGLIQNEDGSVADAVPETTDTQEAITYFCMLHNFDRSRINIESIKESVTPSGGNEEQVSVTDDYEDDYEDEQARLYAEKQEAMLARIDALGMCVDTEKHEVRGKVIEPAMLNVIKNYLKHKEMCTNGYNFKLYDTEKHMLYDTPYVVSSRDISGLQSVYTTYIINSMALRG